MSTGEEDWGLLHVELSPSAMKQLRTHLDWGEVPPSDFRLDVDEDSAAREPSPPSTPSEGPLKPSDHAAKVVAATIARLQCADSKLLSASQDAALADWTPLPPTPIAADVLRKDGCLVLENVLPPGMCDALRAVVDYNLDSAVAAGTDKGAAFGNVLVRQHRWDMRLLEHGVVAKALRTVRARLAEIQLFRGVLGPDGVDALPSMIELSSLISDPGAPRQPVHPDVQFDAVGPQFTVFVALQDTTADMGPTLFLPQTVRTRPASHAQPTTAACSTHPVV